jgi:hypothetical protein
VPVYAYVNQLTAFDQEFARVVSWAEENRACIHAAVEASLGPLDIVLDLQNNTFEQLSAGGAIIRKDAVHVKPGDLNIIPSQLQAMSRWWERPIR